MILKNSNQKLLHFLFPYQSNLATTVREEREQDGCICIFSRKRNKKVRKDKDGLDGRLRPLPYKMGRRSLWMQLLGKDKDFLIEYTPMGAIYPDYNFLT